LKTLSNLKKTTLLAVDCLLLVNWGDFSPVNRTQRLRSHNSSLGLSLLANGKYGDVSPINGAQRLRLNMTVGFNFGLV